VRLSFSHPPAERLEEGVRRLGVVLRRLQLAVASGGQRQLARQLPVVLDAACWPRSLLGTHVRLVAEEELEA
jgi:hypothetical protein